MYKDNFQVNSKIMKMCFQDNYRDLDEDGGEGGKSKGGKVMELWKLY